MKLFIALTIALICFACNTQSKKDIFFLNGNIKDADSGIVYLSYTDRNGNLILDTSILHNSSFHFFGKLPESEKTNLKADLIVDLEFKGIRHYEFIDLFLEPCSINAIAFAGHPEDMKFTGSKIDSQYQILLDSELTQRKALATLSYNLYREKDLNKAALIHDKMEPYFSKIRLNEKHFIITHPDSYLSAYLLYSFYQRINIDLVKQLYDELSTRMQQSYYGEKVAGILQKSKGNFIGSAAASFTARNVNNSKFSLSDYRGKYVLLDFWASWCIPCRRSNPHLIRIFKEYHDKGLAIISLSNDDDYDLWKRAVIKDGMNVWTNALDQSAEEDFNNNTSHSIAREYAIFILPFKVLIDKHGIIIGRYEGTEEDSVLDKKLTEIFKH